MKTEDAKDEDEAPLVRTEFIVVLNEGSKGTWQGCDGGCGQRLRCWLILTIIVADSLLVLSTYNGSIIWVNWLSGLARRAGDRVQ